MLVAACFLSALVGCSDSVEQAVADLSEAARIGDSSLLLSRVRRRGRILVEATLAMSTSTGGRPRFGLPGGGAPLEIVSLRDAGGDQAAAVVREAGRTHVLPMVLEEGRWRVDLSLLSNLVEFGDAPWRAPPIRTTR